MRALIYLLRLKSIKYVRARGKDGVMRLCVFDVAFCGIKVKNVALASHSLATSAIELYVLRSNCSESISYDIETAPLLCLNED